MIGLNCTRVLTIDLQAVYSFMTGDDLQAWRLVGIVARWCLEMGLHQSATISKTFKDAGKRKMAMRLFWCVYTLDRRWGFGAGLPFVMHNFDVDQQLPEPVSYTTLSHDSATIVREIFTDLLNCRIKMFRISEPWLSTAELATRFGRHRTIQQEQLAPSEMTKFPTCCTA